MMLHWISFFLVLNLSNAAIREPWVENLNAFMDKDDCNKIIEAAEAVGFPNSSDSIDYNDPRSTVSWSIDVELDHEIEFPSIAFLYKKYLPKLRDVVADRKFKMNNGDTSEPTLDWVFLRKYTAGEERRMLKLHNDVNLFTINIALNDDFEGGGLFYHKNDDSYFEGDNPLPNFPEEKLDYEYLEKITRENSSEIVFPDLKTGDLIIYNHTLFHAIAPIENGTRYSLIFFYDMHHPDVKRHFPEEFEVLVDNGFDFPIDLYVVDNQSVERSLVLVMEDITEKTFNFEGMPGQLYEVFDRGTGKLVHSFDIYNDNEEGEEYVVYIGFTEDEEIGRRGKLGKDDAEDLSARIENNFAFPVSLYWINPDTSDRKRELFEELLPVDFEFGTIYGHEFEIVKIETGEIVHSFGIQEADEDGEFIFSVGPNMQEPMKDHDEL